MVLLFVGFTQGDVGAALGLRYPNDFSQTTISRFEASNLSCPNMQKLKPLLQRFLDDQQNRTINLVSNTLANRISPEPIISDTKRRKKRTTIEDNSKEILELCFQSNPKPTASDLTRIANEHNIKRDVVRVWFCNRRQREKKLPKYLHPRIYQQMVGTAMPTAVTPCETSNHIPVYGVGTTEQARKTSTTTTTTTTNVSNASQKDHSKPMQSDDREAATAAISAAMMSPQGATFRGYVQPVVYHNNMT